MPVVHLQKIWFIWVAFFLISVPLFGQEIENNRGTTAEGQANTQNNTEEIEPVDNIEILPDSSNTGYITIKGTPEAATAFINSEDVGDTPLIESRLKNGTYSIKVAKDGFKDYKTEITINGESAWIVYELERILYGHLTVESDPDSSDVYLNNEKIGVTPLVNKVIPCGSYLLTIKKTGYQTHESSCEITGSENKYLTFTMTPLIVQHIQKTSDMNISTAKRKTAIKKSMKLPGQGQRYLGQRKKGNIITTLQIVTLAGTIAAYSNASIAVDRYDEAKLVYRNAVEPNDIQIAWDNVRSKHDSAKSASTLAKVVLFGTFGVYVWNVIDAGFISKPADISLRKLSLILAPVISDNVSGIAANVRF
ncbi:MAG: PEGA domain-containing protein [Candidatus Latescibacteria bacterium]|nr:PEGA domain-containing protein [Candidatus Latescibacterota bacterium]